MFRCLNQLITRVPIDQWCLIGGLMVIVAGRLEGAVSDRASRTKDGDIVIDVVADGAALAKSLRFLQTLGYEGLPGDPPAGDVARCTLVTGFSQIDLLAPDDATEESLRLHDGFRSLAVPGGRRALELAEPVTVLYGEEGISTFRVPTLYGAIAVKAHACVDARTRDQLRHRHDVGFLLSVIEDPTDLAMRLGEDAEIVRALAEELGSDADPAWLYLSEPDRMKAQAALRFL